MDTESLKAFIAVAQARSFSHAANLLFLTQPAVSKRISSLEARLNHTLFDRLGKEVVLTEAGKTLLPDALNILKEIENTERRILELSGKITGSLKLATSHHIGLHHLPPVLRAYASEHKGVKLHVEFLDSEQAHEKVLKGECELAIVTLAPKVEPPLHAELLWRDPLSFVAGKDHRLVSRSSVTLRDLSTEESILPDLKTYTGRLVKQRFEQANLPLNLNMSTNYLETIKMMISVGLGWSVLPKTLLDEQLVELDVNDQHIERRLGVISHSKRTPSNAARAFLDVLRANASTA